MQLDFAVQVGRAAERDARDVHLGGEHVNFDARGQVGPLQRGTAEADDLVDGGLGEGEQRYVELELLAVAIDEHVQRGLLVLEA